jgi:hypothetical protein
MAQVSELEKLIFEARAKIIWGEAPQSIAAWLRSHGIDDRRIQEVLGAAMRERDTEIRRQGSHELVIGILITAVSGGLMLLMGSSNMRSSRIFILFFAGFVYGSYRLASGAVLLAKGANARGSVGSFRNDD